MKETFKQAGYHYIRYCKEQKIHLLMNEFTNDVECFFANKNKVGWGLTFKNTHLEYMHNVDITRLQSYY